MSDLFHKGNRRIQDQFNSRKLADRVNEIFVRDELSDDNRDFIQAQDMFFISTVDDLGRPTVSYKGGNVGFLKVIDKKTIAFPNYDGNGMFLTVGNMLEHHHVGLLFIDFLNSSRLRVHGSATIDNEDPLLSEYLGAQQIIRIKVRNVFPNCPRYIHSYEKIGTSKYVPQEDCVTPEPEWKSLDDVKDVLPENND